MNPLIEFLTIPQYNDLREAVVQGPKDMFQLVLTLFLTIAAVIFVGVIILMATLRFAVRRFPSIRRLFAELFVLRSWNRNTDKWLAPNATDQFKSDVKNLQTTLNPDDKPRNGSQSEKH